MTRLANPDPAHGVDVLHALPEELDRLELDPKLRELAILRVTHRTHAHAACIRHVAMARRAGVTDAQIVAIPYRSAEPFSMKERLALTFVDELIGAPHVSENLREQMRNVFSSREIAELQLVVGRYRTGGHQVA